MTMPWSTLIFFLIEWNEVSRVKISSFNRPIKGNLYLKEKNIMTKEEFIFLKKKKEEIERDNLGFVSDRQKMDLIYRQNEIIMALLLKKECEEINKQIELEKKKGD